MKNSSQTSESKDSSPTAKLKSSLNSMMDTSFVYLLGDQVKSYVDANGVECDPDLLSAMILKTTNRLRIRNAGRSFGSGSTEPLCLPFDAVARSVCMELFYMRIPS